MAARSASSRMDWSSSGAHLGPDVRLQGLAGGLLEHGRPRRVGHGERGRGEGRERDAPSAVASPSGGTTVSVRSPSWAPRRSAKTRCDAVALAQDGGLLREAEERLVFAPGLRPSRSSPPRRRRARRPRGARGRAGPGLRPAVRRAGRLAPAMAAAASATPFSGFRKVKAQSSRVWPSCGVSVPWPVAQIQSASGSRPASRARDRRALASCGRAGRGPRGSRGRSRRRGALRARACASSGAPPRRGWRRGAPPCARTPRAPPAPGEAPPRRGPRSRPCGSGR